MKEYIERAGAMEAILGLTIVDAAVAPYANAVFCHLQNLPAADVVEVRHGRWIKHEGYDECELCHAKTIYGGNYCPECGTRMDKEDEHEASK